MSELTDTWTVNQLVVQEWEATPRDARVPSTQEELADALRISDRTITRWRKLDGWQDAVNAKARKQVGGNLPEVYGALVKKATRGSFPHIKLILEMTGEYVEKSDVTVHGDMNITSDDMTQAAKELADWLKNSASSASKSSG